MKKDGHLSNNEIIKFVTYEKDSKKMTYDEFLELAALVNKHIAECEHCLEKVRMAQDICDSKTISPEGRLLASIYGFEKLCNKKR